MSRLTEALQTENTTTKNGMETNSSSLNECVNLFFSIGAMRGKSSESVVKLFSKAFSEEPTTALRILFGQEMLEVVLVREKSLEMFYLT